MGFVSGLKAAKYSRMIWLRLVKARLSGVICSVGVAECWWWKWGQTKKKRKKKKKVHIQFAFYSSWQWQTQNRAVMKAVSLPHREKSYNGATIEEVHYKTPAIIQSSTKAPLHCPPLQSQAEELSYGALWLEDLLVTRVYGEPPTAQKHVAASKWHPDCKLKPRAEDLSGCFSG